MDAIRQVQYTYTITLDNNEAEDLRNELSALLEGKGIGYGRVRMLNTMLNMRRTKYEFGPDEISPGE